MDFGAIIYKIQCVEGMVSDEINFKNPNSRYHTYRHDRLYGQYRSRYRYGGIPVIGCDCGAFTPTGT